MKGRQRPETAKTAGRRIADYQRFAATPSPVSHVNRAPVDYNRAHTRQVSQMLARHVIDEHKQLLKSLQALNSSNVVLTYEEQETLRDTARLSVQPLACYLI